MAGEATIQPKVEEAAFAIEALEDQMKKYFCACYAVDYYDTSKEHRQKFYENQKYIDKMITDKIVPQIQRMIIEEGKVDYMGRVGTGYDPSFKVIDGKPVYFIHNAFAFHDYTALNKEMVKWHKLQLPTNFSVKGKHPDKVIEETLEMFDAFCKLKDFTFYDLKPFTDKYELQMPQNGIENLMSALIKDLADDNVEKTIHRVNDTFAKNRHSECSDFCKFLIMQYMALNYGSDIRMEGSKVYLDDIEVSVQVKFSLERNTTNENFIPYEISLCFDEVGEGYRGLRTSFKIDKNLGQEYGELYTLLFNEYVATHKNDLFPRRENITRD